MSRFALLVVMGWVVLAGVGRGQEETQSQPGMDAPPKSGNSQKTLPDKEAAPSEQQPTLAQPKSDGAAEPALTGRLPRYFGSVVDVAQRQAIYRIQAGFRERREKLEAQLMALKASEMQEIESVLSDEQLDYVQERREQASLRSTASRSSAEKPTEVSEQDSTRVSSVKKS